MSEVNAWKIAYDSTSDSIQGDDVGNSTDYEIYSIGYSVTDTHVVFAFNANLPREGISSESEFGDGWVAWGDLILNFSGQSLNEANGSLYAIRFDTKNNSGASSLGLYQNVSVKSVVPDNGMALDETEGYGDNSLGTYHRYVQNQGGIPGLGDLAANSSYFNQDEEIRNVIDQGTYIGNIKILEDPAAIQGFLGSNYPAGGGTYTFGFAIPRTLLPQGSFIAHIAPDCGNDVIAIEVDPCITIEKSTNGKDADTLDSAAVIDAGEAVTWIYEVTNCGNLPFDENDVEVTDDQEGIPVLDRSSDVGNDGILSPGETWIYTAQGVAKALLRDVDFETDAAGNPLEEGKFTGSEYADWGLTISRIYEDGEVKDPQQDQNDFDLVNSSNPNISETNDDLGTPNEAFGGPGKAEPKGDEPPSDISRNTTALNNVLVLSRPNRNDPTDDPNGGTFRFEWDTPQTVRDISFLDMDYGEAIDSNGDDEGDTVGLVYTYDAAGNLIQEHIISPLGDNSVQTLDIGDDNVSRMEVVFFGSGAITGLSFEDYYRNIGNVRVPGASDEDPSHYVAPNPDIEIKKFAVINGERFDADTLDEAALAEYGDAISWEYHVTNTGNVDFDLEDYTITVTDDDTNVVLSLAREGGIAADILSVGETWYYTGTYAEDAGSPLFYTVDFDTDAQGNEISEGELIADQYADWGLTISTDVPKGKDHGATVLDSGNPNPYKKNVDMVTDKEQNVLIHSRNPLNSSSPVTDRYDGGTFIFEWNAPVDVGTMQFLDIEEDEGETIKIRTYGKDGGLIDTLFIENNDSEGLVDGELVNGGLITVDIRDRNVAYMEVEFDGSGAITDFTFSRPYYVNTGTVTVTANDGENIIRDSTKLIDRDLSYIQPLTSKLQADDLINGGTSQDAQSGSEGLDAFIMAANQGLNIVSSSKINQDIDYQDFFGLSGSLGFDRLGLTPGISEAINNTLDSFTSFGALNSSAEILASSNVTTFS